MLRPASFLTLIFATLALGLAGASANDDSDSEAGDTEDAVLASDKILGDWATAPDVTVDDYRRHYLQARDADTVEDLNEEDRRNLEHDLGFYRRSMTNGWVVVSADRIYWMDTGENAEGEFDYRVSNDTAKAASFSCSRNGRAKNRSPSRN